MRCRRIHVLKQRLTTQCQTKANDYRGKRIRTRKQRAAYLKGNTTDARTGRAAGDLDISFVAPPSTPESPSEHAGTSSQQKMYAGESEGGRARKDRKRPCVCGGEEGGGRDTRCAPRVLDNPRCRCHPNNGDCVVGGSVVRAAAFARRDYASAVVFYNNTV